MPELKQRGRVGRKTADEERKMLHLLDKCFDFLDKHFDKFDQKTQVHIALELVKRRVPQEVEHKGDIHLTLAERIKEGRNRVAQFHTQTAN